MTPFYFRQSAFTITRGSADWIKLVAAIMIALHHYSQYVWTNHLSDSIIYHIMCSLAGFIGVAIFFFLSGYGLMESEKKRHLAFGAFIKRRLLKVYVPVVFATALWLSASLCNDSARNMWKVYGSIIVWSAAIILFTGIWESQYAKYALLDYVFIFIFMLVFTMWHIDIRSKLAPIAGYLLILWKLIT